MVLFGIFTSLHAFAWYRGVSCGCFGSLVRSDSVVLIANMSVIASHLALLSARSKATAVLLPVWSRLSIGGAVACFAMSSGQMDQLFLDREELIPIENGAAVLEPQAWVGKRFPLVPYLEESAEQSWSDVETVYIVNSGCARCQMVANELNVRPNRRSVVVWVTGGSLLQLPNTEELILPNQIRWAVRAPVEIQLLEGRVTSVRYL